MSCFFLKSVIKAALTLKKGSPKLTSYLKEWLHLKESSSPNTSAHLPSSFNRGIVAGVLDSRIAQ